MRKLKLLLATLTLLVGGVSSASAQSPNPGDDMTANINNPNFADNADGWTITGPARSFNGTGFDGNKFIELTEWGSSWDATISQNVTVPNGYYKVKAAGQMSGASDCWMKLVANGAENYFSRNGDTKGNILADGTETTIGGDGAQAGWRYSSVIAKVTDGTLAISCVGHSDVKERWANFDHVTLTYLGEELAAGSDVTDFINNWDFWGCFNGAFNGWSISAPNGGNTWKNGDSNVEYWIGSAANGAFDYYQELTGLPAGNYIVSASMWNSTNGEDPAPAGVDEQCGVYGTSSSGTVFKGINTDGDALNTYTTDGILVSDGALRIGVKNNETMGARWFGVDWIKLTYQEPCISAFAKEIPSATATALTAGKWYKFTAASDGNHSFDATTIGDIIYTTTDQLQSTATGTTATATVSLTSGTTYYIKSSSAQTLTITPQSFTYTVGEAAADKNYIQKGNTVTVSYASLGTDNPSPTLVKNFSGVTFGGNVISVTPTANGFTFEVPEVTAATDYTLAIPANAIGYSDGAGTYNAAQNITLKTPEIFDGTYYLYDATNKLFLSRGKNNGSRAVVDLYGLPFNLVTEGNGASLISFLDWNDKYMFFDQDDHAACWLYTDGASSNANRFFAFEAATGGYYLRDAAKAVYIKHDKSVLNVPTTTNAEAAVWTVMTKADRDAIVNAYPTTNKSNVITAAGITTTTAAEFETFLADNYAAKDQTSKVGTAKFTGNAGDWTWKEVTGKPTYGTDWTEGFQIAGTWSQTISDLTPGIYKVTVNGFERKAGYALCNTLGADGYEPVTAYFKANNEQLPLASWYSDKEGTNNPNNTSQAATAFNNDKYKNTIYTYVDASGELTLTIGKQDKADGSWVLFNNITLTYYDSNVSSEEITAIIEEATAEMEKPMKPSLYQALKSAKSTFEGLNTVPNYNALRTAIDNTATSVASYAAMKKNYLDPIDAILTSSNIIDPNTSVYDDFKAYSKKYNNYKDASTEDIENAVANGLTIYQGTGARYTSIANILMATGWKIDGTTDALTDGSNFYVNTWSTENAGTAPAKDFDRPFYEMWVSSGSIAASTLTRTLEDLTPNGAYKLTANVRVQGNDKVAGSITMDLNGGLAVDVTAGNKIGETSRYIGAYTAYGKADADGKLTITIKVAADSKVTWLAFRDVKYEKASSVAVTIPASGYATIASALALDCANKPSDLKAYKVPSISASSVTLEEVTEAVAANTGLILEGAAGSYDIPVVASGNDISATNKLLVSDGSVTGGDGIYALANKESVVGFYKVANTVTIPAGKCYLNTNTSAPDFLSFSFGNDATSIKSLENKAENGVVYDLQGRRVAQPAKGLYIQNGKKVMVK